MQTVETLNEGLKRAYTLTITAGDLNKRIDSEVKSMAPQVRMPGFRPGKVPANLVKKMHGPALLREALNNSIQEAVQKLIADEKLRPAMQPSVELDESYEEGKDAEVKVALEVLPEIAAPSIDGLKLERLVVDATDAQIDAQIEQIAAQSKQYEDSAEGYAAAQGDQVVMDFAGKVDGVPFDGGTGEGMAVAIGSGNLIPGFEDQLVGVKVGEEKTISVTFPEEYGVATLAGQPATFDLKITAVKTPKTGAPDDEFAKSLGLESLEKLRELIKERIESEHGQLTRTHMKRKLLDQLADAHDFDVPPSMVEAEFGQIWQQLQHEAGHEADPEAARAEIEKDKDDYQKIAVRRVRLGLLLSEIGQANNVEVSAVEMNRLIAQAAQQYNPKDRERFIQYVQQDPMAAAQLRAPLYEDKVVDFLFDKADVTDRSVSREELEAAIEAEDGEVKPHVHGPDCNHDHDHDHAAKPAKKPAAKKAKAADAEGEAKEAAAEPAKKAPAKKAAAKKAEPAAEAAADAEAAPAKKAPAKKAAAKKPAAKAE